MVIFITFNFTALKHAKINSSKVIIEDPTQENRYVDKITISDLKKMKNRK